MLDIQEAKCFEFSDQICPPPRSYWGVGQKIISVYALGQDTGSEQDN